MTCREMITPQLMGCVTAMSVVIGSAGCLLTTEPVHRVTVEVRVPRTTLVRGDSMTIEVVATNLTSDTLRFMGGGCQLMYEVRDAGNDRVAPLEIVCPAVLRRVVLAPGDSLTAGFDWHGDRTGTFVPGFHSEEALLPDGAYTIRGLLWSTEGTESSESVGVTLVALNTAS